MTHRCSSLLTVVLLTVGTAPWTVGWAQGVQLASHTPVFFTRPRAGAPAVDASNAAVLAREIAVTLDGVPVADALEAIGQEAELRITYAADALPRAARVTIAAKRITVAAALTVALIGTDLDVELLLDGVVSLRPHVAGLTPVVRRRQAAGMIAGRVTDAVTRAPLDQVSVRIEGRGLGAVTASDGRYTVHDVPTGTYRLTARRVGYAPLTNTATVAADSVATTNFALTAAPTRLNELVTTAVGEQRRYEVGNTISTINADSIAPTAPITSLTDLISARAPGVEVLEASGMTGSGEAIRIRGLSSLVLQNDPILIVDGVRQDNSAGGDLQASFLAGGGYATHPTPTRLNDIDFSDIESIDILKGPSASTEYGTDAANGVIVITTKHGTTGRPQWKIAAEQTRSAIPERFPNGYYSWGHLTNGTNTPVDCTLVGEGYGQYASTTGSCVVDSVTQWNPLNHAATSIFGTGDRQKYDLSVSGGSETVRYFVSGGLANETGVIRVPPVFRELADTAALGLPSAAFNPNGEQQRSVRANTAIKLGSTADLSATGSYLSTYQQTPDASFLYVGVLEARALSDPADYFGYGSFGLNPLSELTAIGSQKTDRMAGGLAANWQPTPWFVGHATVGLDHGSQRNENLTYPLANTAYEFFGGVFLGVMNATTDVYSVDVRGTATASLLRGVRAVTSGGVQMVDTRTVGQTAQALNITATNLTLNGATAPTVAQQANRQATLGGYAEEEVGVADRLFLTGALRVDAGSGFGSAYATAAYPKASVSWLALDRGSTTLRVRGAFGESGVQPMNGAAMALYAPSVAYLGGGAVTTYPLNWPGNPHLRPERSVEFEGGVDMGGWGNRVSLDLTGYSKTTRDALVNVSLGGDDCCYTYQENIGEVRNTGVEGSATVELARSRWAAWDVAINASVNHNKLISLAPGVLVQNVAAYPASVRQAPGYSLYGIWEPRVIYTDVNHDGIIEPNEVTVADSASYMGPSLATREASISTHVGLWGDAVTVGGLADYRGGYRIVNAVAYTADFQGNQRQENDPTAPLWLQARAVANGESVYNALDAEDGTFVRVREVSVTYAVPRSIVRALRVQSISVTGAVRNLALWTRYTGVDPEVSNTLGSNVQATPISGGYVVNNDVRQDYGTVPLARYWVVRLNLGF